MEEQSYAKHMKMVPLYHYFLAGLIILTFIGSLINLYRRFTEANHVGRLSAELITLITIALFLTTLFARIFPLKAQDRAIRAEENLRHFAVTGKLLDPRLTIKQIIGLRFASDGEFVELARRAAEEGLSLDAIKKSIKQWRPDYDRL
ncbi:MAG TPA: DUF6526 family protein [Bryobacteraceae bacterium]|nr:DUF6526 family protein [Bryobacteraceae bacterium]